jgi:hypothetical protein
VHPYQFGLLAGGEFGLFALKPAAEREIAMPSRVRIFSRSDSNSANTASMLKNILDMGSAGS